MVKVRQALLIVELDRKSVRKVEALELQQLVQIRVVDSDEVTLKVDLTPDEARALAKNLSKIAQRVANRPEGTP